MNCRAPIALLALCSLLACGLTDIEVENQNDPDRDDVFLTWGAIEHGLVGAAFHQIWMGTNGSGYPAMGLAAMADEITLRWGNYGVRNLSGEPRTPFDNSPDYRYAPHVEDPWYDIYTALSNLYDGLRAIEADTTGLACQEIDCDRVRAWAKFAQGVGHAWLALMFDSAFVLDESIELFDDRGQEISQPLRPYSEVWQAARAYLGSAATLADGGAWSLHPGWLGASSTGLSASDLARLARSHIARWIPQVARTPAERATADWAAVIASVDNGIASDFTVEADGSRWISDYLYFNFITTTSTWSRADYKTIGQYDVSGGYDAWILTTPIARDGFDMKLHPDRRIVDPNDPSGRVGGSDFRYIGLPRFYGRIPLPQSMYGGSRYAWYPFAEAGPMPYLLTEELQLNKAEALLRLNGTVTGQVVDIINRTRVNRGALPPLTPANTLDQVMDAIIYERRIETYGTCAGCAYFNRRGEGALSPTIGADPGSTDGAGVPGGFDHVGNPIRHHQGLVEGTPLHFAPPGKELELLQRRIYTYGGVGTEAVLGSASGAGTGVEYSIWAFYIPKDARTTRAESEGRIKSLVRYPN